MEAERLSLGESERKFLRKFLYCRDFGRYAVNYSDRYVLYLTSSDGRCVSSGYYPGIKGHLDRLSLYKSDVMPDYYLHRSRDVRFFGSDKLILKRMFRDPCFTYDSFGYCLDASSISVLDGSGVYGLKFLLGILNSSFGGAWFRIHGKRRGIGVDVCLRLLRRFPLPLVVGKEAVVSRVVVLVDRLLSCGGFCSECDEELNMLVLGLYGLDASFLECV